LSLIDVLVPWEHQVSAGFTLRGYHSKPSGKPVLHFMHGNGFCGLTYEKILEPLLAHFDLFISDTQGHGNSDAGERYLGWNRSADSAAEIWQHYRRYWKGVEHIACGHSYGAVMSSLMISKQPGLFDRALLLDPVIAPRLSSKLMETAQHLGVLKFQPLARQARVRSTSWANEGALWDYFYQRGVCRGWDDDCLQSYLTHAMERRDDGSIHLKCPPFIESGIFASYPRRFWAALASVARPVDVIYGDRTFPFVKKALPRLQQHNANFRLHEMKGGHCFMQEFPEQSSAKMKALLLAH